nr:MAG TPA: hypothetical protein [Caudoviricetes sp.]
MTLIYKLKAVEPRASQDLGIFITLYHHTLKQPQF